MWEKKRTGFTGSIIRLILKSDKIKYYLINIKMKKISAILVIVVCLMSFNQSADAQVKYGGGIIYSTWLNTPGINARLELPLFEEISLVPMVDISIPRFSTATFINSVSLHLHYNFPVIDELDIYPLAGATFKSYLDFDKTGYDRVYHKFTLNPSIGAGARVNLTEFFSVFGEVRREMFTYHQFVTTVGVLMRPGR